MIVSDPYRWLEDGGAEAVRAWTAAQGRHTRDVLDAVTVRGRVGAVGKDPPQRFEPAIEKEALVGEGAAGDGGEQDQEGQGHHADAAMLAQRVPQGSLAGPWTSTPC